jgi:hypothetical protein
MTTIGGVTYHGGFSWAPDATRPGTLVLDDDAVTLTRIVHETFRGNWDPNVEICRTRAIASVLITADHVAKSRVGGAALLGILGAVATKSTQERATIVVTTKSGEVGYLTAMNQSVPSLLGALSPWLRQHGIAVVNSATGSATG